MSIKIIAFDLDFTICKYPKSASKRGIKKYNFCKPIKKNINLLNKLKNQGFYIKIYTSRGMKTFLGNKKKVKKNLCPLTINQLKKWGVKYDEVIFGKTQYDLLIDDKARNIDQIKTLKQILKFIR